VQAGLGFAHGRQAYHASGMTKFRKSPISEGYGVSIKCQEKTPDTTEIISSFSYWKADEA
jgi:hypothetical protein